MARVLRALVAVVALWATVGCAATLRVDNPRLQTEGEIAVRGTQLVAVIRTAQLALEPLVDARVVTATEALKVAETLGVVLHACDQLVNLLRVADGARDALQRVQALRDASMRARDALKTLTGIPGLVSGDAGKLALSASMSKAINAVADLLPTFGGAQ
jgi:hypothetical protein